MARLLGAGRIPIVATKINRDGKWKTSDLLHGLRSPAAAQNLVRSDGLNLAAAMGRRFPVRQRADSVAILSYLAFFDVTSSAISCFLICIY
jgi:hypothetical protein